MKQLQTFCKIFLMAVLLMILGLDKKVVATTYLQTNQNYYTSENINRGFLDEEISESILGTEIWNKFQIAVSKNLVNYIPGMTFNQYYLANNISPEDNFTVYPNLTNQIVKLPSGAYLNANVNPKGVKDSAGNIVDYLTYVGPTDDRGAYWGDKQLEDPVLFSRLTVGNLPKSDNPKLMVFPSGTYQFPTQIGYGESGTVNDYMLTPKNNFTIPTRYNTVRSDVYLTMRSRAYFGAGVQGAQAFLNAESNRGTVVGSADNPKAYIDTNTNVFLTPQGYDQLGTFSKFMANSVYTSASRDLKKVGINHFSEKINSGLKTIQTNSNTNTIVSGNGGQIQLVGFYRDSFIDNEYTSDNESRLNDASNLITATYYMYTSGNTEQTVVTPPAPNGKPLYSPNVSQFYIETTRPYFTVPATEVQPIQEKTALADFDNLLGVNSIAVTDNGLSPDGEKINVSTDNIKIRVSLDEGKTYQDTPYSFSELKQALQNKEFSAEKITLAYTYAATDGNNSNVGKLPTEIADNTGAYAVPYVRVVIPQPIVEGTVVTKYTDTLGNEIAQRNSTTGVVDTDYNTIAKMIPGYTLTQIPSNATGKYSEGIKEVIYIYTKDDVMPPVVEGTVITKYVDENGKEISGQNQSTGEVNQPYSTVEKAIPGYTIKTVPSNHTGVYTEEVITVTYVYTLTGDVIPSKEGLVVTKYVDETGKEISGRNQTTGTIGEPYTTVEKTIPNYTIKTVPSNNTGIYTDVVITVTYIYSHNQPLPITEGTVITKYVDETGKEISSQNKTTGAVGNPYETLEKIIFGYKIKTVPTNQKGTYIDGVISVTYIYTKVTKPNEKPKGTVITQYLDEDGNEISSRNQTTGEVGAAYSTVEKRIDGYTLRSVSENSTGFYQDGIITVTYIYSRNTVTVPPLDPPKDNNQNQVIVRILPKTGNSSTPFLTVLGLVLLLSIIFVINKRKNTDSD